MTEKKEKSLHDQLREIFLGGEEKDRPLDRARALREQAIQEIETWGNPSQALEDITGAVTIARRLGEPLDRYLPVYYRALFLTGDYHAIIAGAGGSHEEALWRGMAGFMTKGRFPLMSRAGRLEYSRHVMYEYAHMAWRNGFSREARAAAAGARGFLNGHLCDRIVAESWFDEGRYRKAAGIFKKLAMSNPDDGGVFVRYCDACALDGRAAAAVSFLEKHPPAHGHLRHLLLFSLAAIIDDRDGMRRSLDAMGGIARGSMFHQKKAMYERITGDTQSAAASLAEARKLLPSGLNLNAPGHAAVIEASIAAEEAALGCGGSFPSQEILPVIESVYYERVFSSDIKEEGSGGKIAVWNPMKSRVMPLVILLMILLVLFLAYLDSCVWR